MKIKNISLVLFIAAIVFCIIGFIGHSAAWSAAALCFFAAILVNFRR